MTELEIHKVAEGGYVVWHAQCYADQRFIRAPLYACDTIDAALAYIKGRMEPQDA